MFAFPPDDCDEADDDSDEANLPALFKELNKSTAELQNPSAQRPNLGTNGHSGEENVVKDDDGNKDGLAVLTSYTKNNDENISFEGEKGRKRRGKDDGTNSGKDNREEEGEREEVQEEYEEYEEGEEEGEEEVQGEDGDYEEGEEGEREGAQDEDGEYEEGEEEGEKEEAHEKGEKEDEVEEMEGVHGLKDVEEVGKQQEEETEKTKDNKKEEKEPGQGQPAAAVHKPSASLLAATRTLLQTKATQKVKTFTATTGERIRVRQKIAEKLLKDLIFSKQPSGSTTAQFAELDAWPLDAAGNVLQLTAGATRSTAVYQVWPAASINGGPIKCAIAPPTTSTTSLKSPSRRGDVHYLQYNPDKRAMYTCAFQLKNLVKYGLLAQEELAAGVTLKAHTHTLYELPGKRLLLVVDICMEEGGPLVAPPPSSCAQKLRHATADTAGKKNKKREPLRSQETPDEEREEQAADQETTRSQGQQQRKGYAGADVLAFITARLGSPLITNSYSKGGQEMQLYNKYRGYRTDRMLYNLRKDIADTLCGADSWCESLPQDAWPPVSPAAPAPAASPAPTATPASEREGSFHMLIHPVGSRDILPATASIAGKGNKQPHITFKSPEALLAAVRILKNSGPGGSAARTAAAQVAQEVVDLTGAIIKDFTLHPRQQGPAAGFYVLVAHVAMFDVNDRPAKTAEVVQPDLPARPIRKKRPRANVGGDDGPAGGDGFAAESAKRLRVEDFEDRDWKHRSSESKKQAAEQQVESYKLPQGLVQLLGPVKSFSGGSRGGQKINSETYNLCNKFAKLVNNGSRGEALDPNAWGPQLNPGGGTDLVLPQQQETAERFAVAACISGGTIIPLNAHLGIGSVRSHIRMKQLREVVLAAAKTPSSRRCAHVVRFTVHQPQNSELLVVVAHVEYGVEAAAPVAKKPGKPGKPAGATARNQQPVQPPPSAAGDRKRQPKSSDGERGPAKRAAGPLDGQQQRQQVNRGKQKQQAKQREGEQQRPHQEQQEEQEGQQQQQPRYPLPPGPQPQQHAGVLAELQQLVAAAEKELADVEAERQAARQAVQSAAQEAQGARDGLQQSQKALDEARMAHMTAFQQRVAAPVSDKALRADKIAAEMAAKRAVAEAAAALAKAQQQLDQANHRLRIARAASKAREAAAEPREAAALQAKYHAQGQLEKHMNAQLEQHANAELEQVADDELDW